VLKIIILNGKLQGSEFGVFEGMRIGDTAESDLVVPDAALSGFSVDVVCDSSGNFVFKTQSEKAYLEIGGRSNSSLEALPGIIFTIGNVGFSIQEASTNDLEPPGKDFEIDALMGANKLVPHPVFPLKKPVRLDFVRGALLNTSIPIHWLPFSIGSKSTLHNFIDEHIRFEDDVLSFENPGHGQTTTIFLQPHISNFIYVNKSPVSQRRPIVEGDLIEFSNTAFYVRFK